MSLWQIYGYKNVFLSTFFINPQPHFSVNFCWISDSNRHVLKNESGEYIQLPSEITAAIYDVLKTLGVTWEVRKDKDKKEKYKTDDTKLTKNEKANLIMSLIRGDKKDGVEPVNPIEDNFDYKDIRDDYLGDLVDTGFVI